jgi:hypothetical protein
VAIIAAKGATGRDVVALDDAFVAARGRALRHAVTGKATVVATDATAAVQVVAVLVAAIAVTAEEALVTASALAIFASFTVVVVVTTERGTGDQYGEERYEPSHRLGA